MDRIRNLPESSFLKLFFGVLSGAFLLAAVLMPDRAQMLSGLWRILSSPAKISTNNFWLGGFSATFLNMGLVGLCYVALFALTGAPANNVSAFGFILTVGFSAWGINLVNLWPPVLGVALYCLVKKEKMNVNAMLFSTGIAPLISDLLVRYPYGEAVGFNLPGLAVAMLAGLFIGFLLPPGLAHAPGVHKGFDLYSAAVPICFFAFFLNGVLYRTLGIDLPAAPAAETLAVASRSIVNIFCILLFGACTVFARLMGCRWRDYRGLLKAEGHVVSVSGQLGTAVFLMNVGIFGLFILAYYNLIGAAFNSVTLGIIFCMLATCDSGSHPGNVWPIMAGYAVTSVLFGWLSSLAGGSYGMQINAQAICVGLCFANGLSPVVSKYGPFWGAVAGGMHFLLVTSVPNMHGGYCLYNGGFTAAAVALILVPVLEKLCRERKTLK